MMHVTVPKREARATLFQFARKTDASEQIEDYDSEDEEEKEVLQEMEMAKTKTEQEQ